jgi:hypothetical protein
MEEIPQSEQRVIDKLVELRHRLQLLNKDKTQYIKSQDVLPIYNGLVEQIETLNAIRGDKVPNEPHNRVDAALDDVFQLLSLSYMAAGKNLSSPAVYVQAVIIQVFL